MTDAKEIVDELIRFGYIVPDPVIGVTVSFVDVDTAMADGAVSGCMVMTIEKNSDAYRKGLRVGDIITEINGKTFEDLDGFIEEKNRFEVGDTVELTYWREGDIKTIRVKLHSAT
jgi:serine protease Do